jgi:hypothetical protein
MAGPVALGGPSLRLAPLINISLLRFLMLKLSSRRVQFLFISSHTAFSQRLVLVRRKAIARPSPGTSYISKRSQQKHEKCKSFRCGCSVQPGSLWTRPSRRGCQIAVGLVTLSAGVQVLSKAAVAGRIVPAACPAVHGHRSNKGVKVLAGQYTGTKKHCYIRRIAMGTGDMM